jgi:zinc finger FYVE domain-containing protein 1
VYHVSKVQESLEAEEMDEETKRKKMTEKVVSFLLVDENEEIQVRMWEAGLTWLP